MGVTLTEHEDGSLSVHLNLRNLSPYDIMDRLENISEYMAGFTPEGRRPKPIITPWYVHVFRVLRAIALFLVTRASRMLQAEV